jgi:tRNA(Glu) U13 pseudouridine synthase TruD
MGQGPIQAVESALSNAIHHTRIAIDAAKAKVLADAEKEKAVIASDVRTALAKVQAAVKADAPEVEAAIKKAVNDAVAAVEAALAARGL